MKHLSTFVFFTITLLFMSIDTFGQLNKPDFAYPATVSKDAKADLAKAENEGDAKACINALIRLCMADRLIDPKSIQQSIKLTEATAKKFEGSASESGIFDCLLAKMYDDMYASDRWKYNRRQQPLTPLPEDLTEWSGEQFKNKINDLCKSALSKASALSVLDIADYSEIISADKLTRAYYPTMLDFVCSEVMYIDENIEEKAVATGLEYAKEDSPAQILWLSKAKNPYDCPQYFLDEYEKHKSSPAASLLLGEYIETKMHSSEDYIEEEEFDADGVTVAAKSEAWFPLWGVPAIDEYLKANPTAYLRPWLAHLRKRMLQKSASLTMPAYCMPGDTVDVALEVVNAPSVTVSLYYIPDADYGAIFFNNDYFKSHKPQAQKRIQVDDNAPFKKKETARFLIKKSGYYAAVPDIGEEREQQSSSGAMRCMPIYPISADGLAHPVVAIVNPKDGTPIEHAQVTLSRAKTNNRYAAQTNADGIADFSNFNIAQSPNRVSVRYEGVDYAINNAVPSISRMPQENDSKAISVLTDRGLYHPGDKVNALIVASHMHINGKGEKNGTVIAGMDMDILLKNANWETIDTVKATTDEYGRATAEFSLPKDGLTGNFRIEAKGKDCNGATSFMVSDYKMPDFEIKVTSTLMDEPQAGSVTLKGKASYYSGMPLYDAEITVTLMKSSYIRWRFSSQNVFSDKIATDKNGEFIITFNSDALGDEPGECVYTAIFEATSPAGSTASCESGFLVGKKYVIDVDEISNINGELPFNPHAKAVDSEGMAADIPLTWNLIKDKKMICQGRIGIPVAISDVRPGRYTLRVSAADSELAAAAEISVLIYNQASGISPVDDGLWTLDSSINFTPGTAIEALIAVGSKSTVYCFASSNDDLIFLKAISVDGGYEKVKIDMPANAAERCKVIFATVKNFNCSTAMISLSSQKDDGIKIIGEAFRDKLVPGQKETWKLRLADTNGNGVAGAVALDMFNKALDAIKAYSPTLRLANIYWGNYLSIETPYSYQPSASAQSSLSLSNYDRLVSPKFVYGFGREEIVVTGFGRGNAVMYKSAAMDLNASMADGAIMESEEEEAAPAEAADEVSGNQATESDNYDYRDSDVPMAVWAPALATDAEGNLCYSFTVPNANTTWKLTALAWTKDLRQGRLVREFVASKPIMVAPNAPRFLRQGDICQVTASVLNNTDSACVATTVAEIFNPANGAVISSKTFVNELAPKASATICIEIEAALDLSAIGYRVRTDNGQGFSDGEQSAIPVLSSMAAVVESKPFYLNPGEDTFSTVLPDTKDARLSLTFCENPAWTIVSALPGLRELDSDYANNAAAAIFSACVAKGIVNDNPEIAKALKAWKENPSDSALVSMLEKNEDLKIAVLNATPWVQASQSQSERMASLALIFDSKHVDKAIGQAVEALMKLQKPDGGFAWGQWCEKSSIWTTANVLDMLGQLRHAGWLPKDKSIDDMIAKAVKYYDKEVDGEDMMYAVVRRYFPEIQISLNGQTAISKTTADILKNWKNYSNPAVKALAAEALHLNSYPTKAKDLMNSISQFGVTTPSQGLTFPSVSGLYSYAQILRAYALIMPDSPQVDGLRQQLIIHKQGNDWGSSVVTSEVVSAVICSGSKWTVPAKGTTVTIGGDEIKRNRIESVTGSLKADVSDYAGQRLEINTPGITPAYGAVFAQYRQQMHEVKSASCDDLDIEKKMSVRRADGSWDYASDSLSVGDRVKVQLTIHCKRDLQYVEIIDERPAAFQPADQLPGWIWTEGIGFYRENRDAYTALHVERMPKGTYILTYEMNVSQAGRFSSGIATIQSQYAPEITAHSSGSMIDTISR